MARKAAVNDLVTVTVEREAKALAKTRGKDRPITDEMFEDALQMLSSGSPMDVVTGELGLSRAAILGYAHRNPDKAPALRDAMAMGTVSIVNDTFRVARGEEGYSTGSIERDKMIVDLAWKYAKTIGNRIFGDKLQVEQHSIMVMLPPPDYQ